MSKKEIEVIQGLSKEELDAALEEYGKAMESVESFLCVPVEVLHSTVRNAVRDRNEET